MIATLITCYLPCKYIKSIPESTYLMFALTKAAHGRRDAYVNDIAHAKHRTENRGV